MLRRTDRIYRIQKNGLEVVVTVAPPSIDAKLGPAGEEKRADASGKVAQTIEVIYEVALFAG